MKAEQEQKTEQQDKSRQITLDKTAFSIASSFAESDRDDDRYWWSQSAEARLQHIEYLQGINYGRHAASRLQRILEIARRA